MRMSKVDECLLEIKRNTGRILLGQGAVSIHSMAPGSFTVRTYGAVSARLRESIGRRNWLVSSPCSLCDAVERKEIAEKLSFDKACLVFCENSRGVQRVSDSVSRGIAAMERYFCREGAEA
ncbi:MAG: hypothetical protein II837_06910 [Treponema sp.]|nr:hypothetical protein [Treponema sp.]